MTSQRDKRLMKIWREVENSDPLDNKTITSNLKSSDKNIRLRALLHIRKKIENGRRLRVYFELASRHITDSDNICRWQSVIIVGEFLDKNPEDIWKIIMRFGSSKDTDMRTAIGTVLLEHYFEHNRNSFKKRFATLKKEIEKGNKYLRETLSICRFHFTVKRQNEEISRLLTDIK